MSTDEILTALVKSGALKLWMPTLEPDETVHRHLYMRPDVFNWVETDKPDAKSLWYFATVRQLLKDFVVGEHFDDQHKLKNLDTENARPLPDQGLFAVRLQRADPKARIFCGFAKPNVLILTHQEKRVGVNWGKEKARSLTIWDGQFRVTSKVAGQAATIKLPLVKGMTRAALTCNNRSMKG